jgi:transcriptional regulator with XRE-family HTH domain
VRFLDRCRSLFAPLDRIPTAGFIRTLREALGLSQARFGERIGVNKVTVYRWEHGELRPGAESLQAIRKLRGQASRKGVMLDG